MFADLGRYLRAWRSARPEQHARFSRRGFSVIVCRAVVRSSAFCCANPNSQSPVPNPDVRNGTRWCIPGRKLKPGAQVLFERGGVRIDGEVAGDAFSGRGRSGFRRNHPAGLADAIDRVGHIPLPPYIKRDDEPDRSRAVSDGVRARARIGRRADRRPAFHDRAS